MQRLQKEGVKVIRMDVGSPDMPPAPFIVEALVDSARMPNTHGYTAYAGPPVFREAVARYYKQRYGVNLDPGTEVVGLIGSKEGIFKLSQAYINPGDVALVPSPGYTTYRSSTQIAGGEVFWMPLLEINGYLPDYSLIAPDILQRAKILWINYPNNPTGAIADRSFFERTIEFARNNGLLVAHDAPYLEILYDGFKPPSILEIPGARDVAVEFNSLSKTYNMAGWRVGMAVGNPEAINLIKAYKVQSDSSHFQAIWNAASAALSGDQAWIHERNAVYQERRDIVVQGLKAARVRFTFPKAALYVWAKVPFDLTDSDFSERLLREAGLSVTPGSIYGQYGSGFFRLSLCTPTYLVVQAMDRLADWVNKSNN